MELSYLACRGPFECQINYYNKNSVAINADTTGSHTNCLIYNCYDVIIYYKNLTLKLIRRVESLSGCSLDNTSYRSLILFIALNELFFYINALENGEMVFIK